MSINYRDVCEDFYKGYIQTLKTGKVPEGYSAFPIGHQKVFNGNLKSLYNTLKPNDLNVSIYDFKKIKYLCRKVAKVCLFVSKENEVGYTYSVKTGFSKLQALDSFNPYSQDYVEYVLNYYAPVVTCHYSIHHGYKVVLSMANGLVWSWSINALGPDGDYYANKDVEAFLKVIVEARNYIYKESGELEMIECDFLFGQPDKQTKTGLIGIMPCTHTSEMRNEELQSSILYSSSTFLKEEKDLFSDFSYYLKTVVYCNPAEVRVKPPTRVVSLGKYNSGSIILSRQVKMSKGNKTEMLSILDLIQENTDCFLTLDPETQTNFCVYDIAKESAIHYTSSTSDSHLIISVGTMLFAKELFSYDSAHFTKEETGYLGSLLSLSSFKKIIKSGVDSFDDYLEEIRSNCEKLNDCCIDGIGKGQSQLTNDEAQLLFLRCFQNISYTVKRYKGEDSTVYTFHGMWKYNSKKQKFFVYLA